MQRLFRSWTVGVGLAVGSFVLLAAVVPDAPLHFDIITDYLIARDCVELRSCGSHAHSVLGLRGGRTVVYLLLTGQALGLGPAGTMMLAHVLNALSVFVVWHTARRYISPAAAIVAAVASIGTVLWLTGLPNIWNPTMAPLPLALFFCALLALVHKDGAHHAFFAGAMIGAAMSAHQICMVLIPILWFISQLVSDRPNLAVFASIAGLMTSTLTLDYPVTLENVERLADAGLLAPTGVGLCAALVVGAVLRRSATRAGLETLVGVLLLGITVIAAAASAALSMYLGAGVELRYLIAVAPALPLAAAWLVWRLMKSFPPGRRPFVLAGATLIIAWFLPDAVELAHTRTRWSTSEPHWTMTEGVELTRQLGADGLDLASSQTHLLSRSGRELRPMFAIAARRQTQRPGPDAPVHFVARPSPTAEAELGNYRIVVLSTGRPALLGVYRPWIVPDAYRVCFKQRHRLDAGECADVTSDSHAPLSDPRRRASQLSDLAVPEVGAALERARNRYGDSLVARYELRVEPREDSPRIGLLMTDGQIVVDEMIDDNGGRVVLTPGAAHTLVVEVGAHDGNFKPLLHLPAILELRQGEEEVETWLDTVRQRP